MSEAEGSLKEQCHTRDGWSCRWCGRHGAPLDAHHIRFRRGTVDDVLWNLISLCRGCHQQVVHENTLMTKREMQELLWELARRPGVTGMQLLRWNNRRTSTPRST